MRVGIIGDVHGNTKALQDAVNYCEDRGAKWTCCVGDLGLGFSDPFAFAERVNASGLSATILGNHDECDYDGNNARWKEYGFTTELIRRGERRVIGGRNFLFMGGGESLDRHLRQPYVNWWPGESIREQDIMEVDPLLPTDVVVSHTMPMSVVASALQSISRVNLGPHRCQSERLLGVLSELLSRSGEFSKPAFWVGGHWHLAMRTYNDGTYYRVLDRADAHTFSLPTLHMSVFLLDTDTMEELRPTNPLVTEVAWDSTDIPQDALYV